jgi:DNA/RNA-binding domain of Phe-tRNA-synthetase-like protein
LAGVYFEHSARMWTEHPELVAGVVRATGITDVPAVELSAFLDAAARGPESELPQIQAWRRAFTRMGLKPTQYRCAAESLLRRFRKEGALPSIHPLIDLCNAVSLAFAVPIAVFDVAEIDGGLAVRHADGDETYLTFAGTVEHPDAGEVIFADEARQAHARRWTNRQSGRSAVRPATAEVLIVAEALHDTAAADVPKLLDTLCAELVKYWAASPHDKPVAAVLRADEPRFEC